MHLGGRRLSVVIWILASAAGCSTNSGGTPDLVDAGTLASDAATVAADDYLVMGLASTQNNETTIVVVDAASPFPPRFTETVSVNTEVVEITDASYDAASRRYRSRRTRQIAYAKDGKIYLVSLRKRDQQIPKQLSSLSTACGAFNFWQIDPSGEDAWLAILEAGPDGDCANFDDDRINFVRTSMDADAAAKALPTGVSLVFSLVDSSHVTREFLMHEEGGSPKLSIYDTNLARVGDVSDSEGVEQVDFVGNEYGVQSAILRVDGTLRRLNWHDGGASLSVSLRTLVNVPYIGFQPLYRDTDAIYFADGAELLKVPVGGPVSSVVTADATIALIRTGNDYVFLETSSFEHGLAVASIPKTRGSLVDLPGNSIGVTGNRMVYVEGIPLMLRAIDGDGQNDTLLAESVGYATFTYSPEAYVQPTDAEGIIFCEPAHGDYDCKHGALKELFLPAGPTITLGSFSSEAERFSFRLLNSHSGVPNTFTVSDETTDMSDVYMYTPGLAGSLVRITNNLR